MALTDGLAEIPADPRRRSARGARACWTQIGVAALHAQLAARIPKQQRDCAPAIRSARCAPMKCSRPTGRPLAEWQAIAGAPLLEDIELAQFLLDPPRAALARAHRPTL